MPVKGSITVPLNGSVKGIHKGSAGKGAYKASFKGSLNRDPRIKKVRASRA